MAGRARITAWIEKHQGIIGRWASWKTRKLNRSDLEDVVQQVSVELLARDDEVRNPEALAKQITSFRVIDALRRQLNAPRSIEECEDDVEMWAVSQNGHRRSVAPEQEIDVYRAVGNLPEPGQSILWLRIVEEDTFASIASKLGLPEANVRYHFGRAVKKLKKTFNYVGIGGLVIDDGGSPLPGAHIAARGVSIRDYRKTQTDQLGQFAMASLRRGRYSVRTTKAGYDVVELYLDLAKPMQSCTITLRKSDVGEKREAANAKP